MSNTSSTAVTMAKKATFGAGCFWGVEKAFRRKFQGHGLISATVGYAGGQAVNPTYRQVCTGSTGHAEVVQIEYDPTATTFTDLVDFFFRSHDPSSKDRQGNDVGSQYRSCVLPHSEEDAVVAQELVDRFRPRFGSAGISTTIETGWGKTFYPAETYHQQYLEKNPHGYECPTHFEQTWEQICKAFGGRM